MKHLVKGVAVLVCLISISAYAVFRPGHPTPYMSADLVVQNAAGYPIAINLTKFNNGTRYGYFTLLEDTGIRCVTTPCPSTQEATFDIVDVQYINKSTVIYHATERGNLIGRSRTLKVEEIFMGDLQWNVSVADFMGDVDEYLGYPEAVYTIMNEAL